MREGNIILTYLPQSDGSNKLRPVLLLKALPAYNDYLVCGISTQIHQEIADFDIILTPDATNRLRATSLVRLSFLAILNERDINGSIGAISLSEHRKLLENLAHHLTK
jgi:mRNA interferase MazF